MPDNSTGHTPAQTASSPTRDRMSRGIHLLLEIALMWTHVGVVSYSAQTRLPRESPQ
jgi:hypothetical protein